MFPARLFARPPVLRTLPRIANQTRPALAGPASRCRAISPTYRLASRNFSQNRVHPTRYGRYPPPEPPELHEYSNHHDPRLRNARPLVTTSGLWRVAKSRNTHGVMAIAVLAAVVFYFSNIQTVPVSGRKRFNCFSTAMVEEVSAQQVKRVEYEVERAGGRFLPDWDPRTMLVKRVMRKLIPVSGLEDQDWEIRVIDDPNTLNAFVLPGGKVFVHSGILRVTRTEAGLAAVLGHEIAHNLAEHVGERMSGAIGVNILLGSLFFLSLAIPYGVLAVQFFGGNFLDILFERPMSRLQESEADYIGLMLMAEACYDPREAVSFWQRMDRAAKSGNAVEVPEFISTHPSNEHRIEKYQEWMPKAMEKWDASNCQGSSRFADLFRQAMARGAVIVE